MIKRGFVLRKFNLNSEIVNLGLVLFCVPVGMLTACSSTKEASTTDKVIVVPSTATSAPPYRGDGSPSSRRYVVRMSDGKRDWEVEFPESANGYQLRIPLNDGKKDLDVQGQPLTKADKELLESRRRQNVATEREGVYAGRCSDFSVRLAGVHALQLAALSTGILHALTLRKHVEDA